MLPWADCVRISNVDYLSALECVQDVRNQTILSPVPATDYVTRSDGSDSDAVFRIFRLVEKRRTVGGSDKLSASFAIAVRIVAAHRLVFPIAPNPFAVLITLVGSDIDDGLDTRRIPHGFQQMHGTHDVGGIRLDR